MRSAFGMLFQSRKFWLTFLDVVISTALYFGAKYAGAGVFEDIQWLLLAYQPMFVMLIYTIAKEDVALTEAAGWLPDEYKDEE
jgi:hypothetical protein